MEAQKKALEDENKRKRAELLKQINERKHKTLAEAQILNQIQVSAVFPGIQSRWTDSLQAEVAQLDASLSFDIGIIRARVCSPPFLLFSSMSIFIQIETSSKEYDLARFFDSECLGNIFDDSSSSC